MYIVLSGVMKSSGVDWHVVSRLLLLPRCLLLRNADLDHGDAGMIVVRAPPLDLLSLSDQRHRTCHATVDFYST